MTYEDWVKIIQLSIVLGKNKREIMLTIGRHPDCRRMTGEMVKRVKDYLDGAWFAIEFARQKLLAQHTGKKDLGLSDPTIVENREWAKTLEFFQQLGRNE